MVVYATLCYILTNGKVLLLKKSEGLFGGGRWNGLGGKIDKGEMPEQACVREVFEESGLSVNKLRYHGLLKFWFGDDFDWVVHVFSTNAYEGELRESTEGILKWIDLDKIPHDEMWDDDRHWLPLLLKGKSFEGEFHYNREGSELVDYEIREMAL